MKRILIFSAIAILIASLLLSSCNKEDTASPTPVEPVTDGFTWKEDNGMFIIADSAFWTEGGWGGGIRAYKGGMSNFFEINFNSADIGSKNLASGFAFLKGNETYSAVSCDIDIVSHANDKLTGTFKAELKGGSIISVTGSFTNLPKR